MVTQTSPTFGQTLTTTLGGVATTLINTFADRSNESTVQRRTTDGTIGGISTGLIFIVAAVVVVIVLVRR